MENRKKPAALYLRSHSCVRGRHALASIKSPEIRGLVNRILNLRLTFGEALQLLKAEGRFELTDAVTEVTYMPDGSLFNGLSSESYEGEVHGVPWEAHDGYRGIDWRSLQLDIGPIRLDWGYRF